MKDFFQGLNVVDEEERMAQHRYWFRLLVVSAVAALFLLGVKKAIADEVRAPDGSVVYVRHDAACNDADILAHILRLGGGERAGEFKKGTLTYDGRDWRSCWIEVGGLVYSIDEEGSPLEPLPSRLFKARGGA